MVGSCLPKQSLPMFIVDKIVHLLNRKKGRNTKFQILGIFMLEYNYGSMWSMRFCYCQNCYETITISYSIPNERKNHNKRITFCYPQCKHGVWWNCKFHGVEYWVVSTVTVTVYPLGIRHTSLDRFFTVIYFEYRFFFIYSVPEGPAHVFTLISISKFRWEK